MPKPKERLSRAQSQERTKEKLLETAKTCFLRDGYAATSLEGIAEAAGFSKGAVYSNFESKDELCLAVLDAIRAERASSLLEATSGRATLEDRIAAFEAWAEHHIGDRAWTALEVEFAVHAARDKKLGRAVGERVRAARTIAALAVAAEVQANDLELPMAAEDVAAALLSLGVGLGVQRAIDPSLPVRSLGKLVRLFVGREAKRESRSRRDRASPAGEQTASRSRGTSSR